MSDQHYIVSFEDVHATCGDVDISAIAEMRLVAPSNGVPQLILAVDGGQSGESGARAVDYVSLDNARAIFDRCRSMVKKDEATLSLSISCRVQGGAGVSAQSLEIRDWMLIDVALSPVQRRGVCLATLTFAHPLYKAHLGGASVGMFAALPNLQSVTGGDPLEVFTNALRLYTKVPRARQPPVVIPGGTQADEMQRVLSGHLDKALAALGSSVTWGGKKALPAATELAGWNKALIAGLCRYAEPRSGNSVLQMLLGGLVPECSLSLGGDYSVGPLVLRPFEPWASGTMQVSDSDITSVEFPQADPSPLSGVRIVMGMTANGNLVSYHVLGGQAGDGAKAFELFYVPKSELSAQHMYGPIQQFREPAWLSHVAMYGANLRSPGESDVVTTKDGGMHNAMNTPIGGAFPLGKSAGTPSSFEYGRAALACAKAYFETSLMKDWAFTLNMRLTFSGTRGGVLCPGGVVSVMTESGEVVGGYVTQVEHVISVANHAAATKLICTHPRFGELPAAITSSTNALYT